MSASLEAPAGFNFTRDVVEQLAGDHDRRALTYVGADGVIQRLTFAELAGDAARWAHLLRGRGHDAGERVLVLVGGVPEWAPIMLGALKAGLVAVPCPAGIAALDLAERATRTGASMVVAGPETRSAAEALRGMIDREVELLSLDEAPSLLAHCRSTAPTEPRRNSDPALVLFSAGTTGSARGIVHGHAYTAAHRVQAGHWLQPQPGDVVWCTTTPPGAASLWNTLLGPWSHGAEVVMHPGGGSAAERLDLVEQLGVTILSQTPREYRSMLEEDPRRPSSLRHAVSTGEPLGSDVTVGFREATGVTICDGYGQTENAVLIASTPDRPSPDGAMGRATPGHEVAIVDAAGERVAAGTEGDIALHGRPATLFLGYLGAPEAAAAASRGDWYVTGDRGVCDENDIFWFAGRADDVIVSGGVRARAFELEERLLAHPAVADAAVVGRPDAHLGQIAKALVVLRPGIEPEAGVEAELAACATAGGANAGVVVETELIGALPLTAAGTIDRAALRRAEARRLTVTRLVDPGPVTAAESVGSAVPERPPRLVLVGGQAIRPPRDVRQRFDAAPLETGSTEPRTGEKTSRRADRARQRERERERKQAAEAERRNLERRRKEEADARRAEEERRRKDVEEQRKREAEERTAEEQRLRAEAKARKEQEAAARAAAKEAERAEREAQRAEEQRLLVAARERKKLAEERRRAEEHERKTAIERQRAEADARRKQDDLDRKAAAARAREEAKAEETRRVTEAEERRRAEDNARRAEREAAEAEEARLEAEASERRRQEAVARRAGLEAAAAEAARAADEERQRQELEQREAEARQRTEEDERRRQDEAIRRAEREAQRAEAERLQTEENERRRQSELDRKVAEVARRDAEAESKRFAEAKRRADEQEREESEARRRAEAEAQELRRAALRPPRPRPEPPVATPAPAPALEIVPVAATAPDDAAPGRAADNEQRRARAARQRVADHERRRARERTQSPNAADDEPEVAALIERIQSYGIHADRPGTPDG